MEPPSRAEIARAAKATVLGLILGSLMAAVARRRDERSAELRRPH